MKWGSERRESHGFETHLNWPRDLTGSLESISAMTSFGRVGIAIDIDIAMASVLFACLVVITIVVVFATVFLTFFLHTNTGLWACFCLIVCTSVISSKSSFIYITFCTVPFYSSLFFWGILDNVKTAMLSRVLIQSVILRSVFRRKYRDLAQSAVIWKILSRTTG